MEGWHEVPGWFLDFQVFVFSYHLALMSTPPEEENFKEHSNFPAEWRGFALCNL